MGKANKERLGAAFPGDCCGRAWVPPACFGAGGTEGTLQGSGQRIRTLCLEQETSDRYRHLAPGRVPWLLVRWASGSRVPGTLVTRLRICGTLRQIS